MNAVYFHLFIWIRLQFCIICDASAQKHTQVEKNIWPNILIRILRNTEWLIYFFFSLNTWTCFWNGWKFHWSTNNFHEFFFPLKNPFKEIFSFNREKNFNHTIVLISSTRVNIYPYDEENPISCEKDTWIKIFSYCSWQRKLYMFLFVNVFPLIIRIRRRLMLLIKKILCISLYFNSVIMYSEHEKRAFVKSLRITSKIMPNAGHSQYVFLVPSNGSDNFSSRQFQIVIHFCCVCEWVCFFLFIL